MEEENISMEPRCYSYIRFSTPEQLKGDSLRRQLKLSEDYAKKKGLVIDESLRMIDKGLSARKGYHRTNGYLGKFLDLAKSGSIPKGSVLLVESLDRLSREKVLDAFDQFRAIIKSDITIVTLSDGVEYSNKTIGDNFNQLLISLSIMARAHEESQTKSKRLCAAWVNKRANINEKPLSARIPAWLELIKDKNKIVEIPYRCKLIKRIFNEYLDGKGVNAIAQMLNKEGEPTWKGKSDQRQLYFPFNDN